MEQGVDPIQAELEAQDAIEQKRMDAEKQKESQRQLVDKWVEKVKRARKHDNPARLKWADDRRVARGDPPDGGAPWLVHTNLVASILEVLAAFLYAKNPDISVRPSPSMDPEVKKEIRAIAGTLEIVVSRLLHDAGLKRVAKRWVRASMTVGVSWIKAAMQTRTERDPIPEQQINDLKDNLAQLEVLKKKLAEGEADPNDTARAEIQNQIVALQGQAERQVAEGLVLDLMAPEDVVVAPDCGEAENYLNAPWIAFDMYKDEDEALAITGWTVEKLKTANRYTQRPRKGEEDEGSGSVTNATQWVQMGEEGEDSAESVDGFFRFTEIWSRKDGLVYTFVEGIQQDWARKPYAPRTGARFYPNFMLAFHPIEGDRWPQSDVYQLKNLQEEYNRTRSNYALHRMRAIPGILFDETVLTPESLQKLSSSEAQEYTGIKSVKPGSPLRDSLWPKTYNPIDPGLYNTEAITQEMEKVSGAQDAVQGGINVEKTATEAQILESGRGARTGARLDILEDALTELAEYTMQLALLTMDRADAMRYAGPQAAWMDMSTDEALTLFALDIKAGSTGKPKALSDRDSWATIMPLLEGMIERIGQAKMMGQDWAAQPWIELIKETGKRLDDPIEVEKFIPEVPPEVIQQNMQPPKPSEKEEAETENTDADTIKKLTEAIEKNPDFAMEAIQNMAIKKQGQGQPEAPMEPPTGIN